LAEYFPTFRHAWPLYLVVGLLACGLLIPALIQAVSYWYALPGTALLVLLCLLRFRYRVVLSEKHLLFTGFWQTKSIEWRDIQCVVPKCSEGYWASRTAGPSTFVFHAPNTQIAINFKLLSLRCFEDVVNHLPSEVQQQFFRVGDA
jgi:hypothetical protein